MKFPKQELDISAYLRKVESLLDDESCHLFIDTNIISQLYKLNENARNDFYDWVDSCNDRFHIPCWSVLEYSKRVTTQNTRDYMSELSKATTISKELTNINRFVRGYVGDSLLRGSEYAGKKEQLFNDLDDVAKRFKQIAIAINKNLTEHQQDVHKEVLDKLNQFTLKSDIYDIMHNLSAECELRFNSGVPPGYKDSNKSSNSFGDMIIWKEIIKYCEDIEQNGQKAIFISRDSKPDMVYSPVKQFIDGDSNSNVSKEDRIAIADESLVYEFKLKTGFEDFYLIDFYTLVKILSSDYRELALSFQIATDEQHESFEDFIKELERIDNEVDESICGDEDIEEEVTANNIKYTDSALADSNYDMTKGVSIVNEFIEKLKSYNWYVQNPAINELMSMSFKDVRNTQQNRDSFFVLGRNVLQSADGTSGSAISFIENLHYYVKSWDKAFQKAFIDGCLYEVFFDSSGEIRANGFKGLYFETVIEQINEMELNYSFDFINTELVNKNKGRFVPEVNSDKKYTFEFLFKDKDEIDILDYPKTELIKINGEDVSETFKAEFHYNFSKVDNLKQSLAIYYAIPVKNIELKELPIEIKTIDFIVEGNNDPFSF